VNYLRRGGSVFHLQKVLGHSTLEMTRRYANLVTADLQAVHEPASRLSNKPLRVCPRFVRVALRGLCGAFWTGV